MAVIRIERVPVSVGGLGLLGFDHLQLVLQQDGGSALSTQDNWFVIEGVRDAGGTLGVEGGNGVTSLSAANGGLTGAALQAVIGTPAQRGSRIIADSGALGTWQLMAAYGREFDAEQFPYISFTLPFSPLPTVNSTSIIASLMYYAGINLATNWPAGTRFSPGSQTLLGTRANDAMSMGQYFTTLLGGQGNDTLEGSNDDRTDRIYGGAGDDLIKWSGGRNYLHGGQPDMDYFSDGIDVVDYAGAGVVEIMSNENYVPGRTPNYIAHHGTTGIDYLYSIERLQWNSTSDRILIDGGQMMQDGLIMGMMGEGSGHGDTVDFSNRSEGFVAVASSGDDEMVVRDAGKLSSEKGLWLQSAEWIIGSSGDDSIYAASGLRGLEGGSGDDLIDAGKVATFTGAAGAHADVELQGGDGDDTLIANAGETLMHGGAGNDWFVLSAATSGAGTVEMTIDDADSGDRIYVPYALLDGSRGSYEGSELMPLLGGIGSYNDMANNGWPSVFDWRTQADLWLGTDQSQGVFGFYGDVSYQMDGGDLLIVIMQGHTETITEVIDNAGHTRSFNELVIDPETETHIRIKGFQQGDLGLQFIDPGTPTSLVLGDGSVVLDYPNWDSAVRTLTNGGHREAALDAAPSAPTSRPDEEQAAMQAAAPIQGTSGADLINLAGAAKVEAGDGNDTVIGSSGADLIDGGAGADSLVGGAGNDTYTVDSVLDVISEAAGGGRDTVKASVSFVLSANVEDLSLTGSAASGTGNALDNLLTGDDIGNVLSGETGNDTLCGAKGDDTLVGGAGSDRYVYALGDGRDVIIDTGTATETNTLGLSGLSATDLRFYRLASAPGDLVIGFPDGGSITLTGFMANPHGAIDGIAFDDGSTLSRAELEAAAAAASPSANPPPVAIDDPTLMIAAPTAIVEAAGLLANDFSPSGLPLHLAGIGSAHGGTVTLRADGSLDVAVDTGGVVDFQYTVSDGQGGTATAHAVIQVATNHAPVAAGTIGNQFGTIGAPFALALATSLFTDADFDPLSFSARLANGAALPTWLVFDPATASFSGTPAAGSSGDLDIVVTASDGLASATTAFRLTVGSANHAPAAVADIVQSVEGLPLTLSAATLIGNDTDVDGDPLTLTSVGAAAHGTVSLLGNGSVLFTPDSGYVGAGGFTYTVEDGRGGSASAAVTVNLAASPGRSVSGTSGNDVLSGTTGHDTLEGGAGNDTLYGLAGNDLFLVNGIATGLDVFIGGAGSDTIRGGAGDDVIGLQNVTGALSGIEVIDGGAGSDALRGTAGNDTIDLTGVSIIGLELIDGGAGDDLITGSAGNDTIKGNTGNDTLRGGGGDDIFLEQGAGLGIDVIAGGAGYDKILGSASDETITLGASSENLSGIEAIDMGAGNDIIVGSAGNDLYDLSGMTLAGLELFDAGAGNDTIVASLSNDTLKGGAGNDVFVIRAHAGAHTVSDYLVGTTTAPVADLLDVSSFGFASFAAVMSHASASGTADTLLTLDASTSLKLLGVKPAQLKSDDFKLA